MGEVEPREFPVATREEMQSLWDSEEEAIMKETVRMF